MLTILPLGCGRGADGVLANICSSSFVLIENKTPIMLFDAGFGVARKFRKFFGNIDCPLYISHNHSDHAAELPVIGAIAEKDGQRLSLLAEHEVMKTLMCHRLDELKSTGKPLDAFFNFVPLSSKRHHLITDSISIIPIQAVHAERTFGLIVYKNNKPIFGVSGDSGFSADFYNNLAIAPTLLIDGRDKGNSEHASLKEIEDWAKTKKDTSIFITGYGETSFTSPHFTIASPGKHIDLGMYT